MSLTGFKKQVSKANQFMSEKIGGVKGTELDEEYHEMERKTDLLNKLFEELVGKTLELMQPNPAYKAKLAAANSFSKMRGSARRGLYPQTEGLLGECMTKYGKELGEDSIFGEALVDCGETYKQIGDMKYNLEDNVKQNFIEPLQLLHTKDIKEVNHHRRKLESRRLDFDNKKRKGHGTKDSLNQEDRMHDAEDKFEETKEMAAQTMFNLLQNDVEFISLLSALTVAEADYHQHSLDLLRSLSETLNQRSNEAASRPRSEYISEQRTSITKSLSSPSPPVHNNHLIDTSGYSLSPAPNSVSHNKTTKKEASCEALYDFVAENEGEMGFMEGDIIKLISQIDENWYEGSVNGNSGFFPIAYVRVINSL